MGATVFIDGNGGGGGREFEAARAMLASPEVDMAYVENPVFAMLDDRMHVRGDLSVAEMNPDLIFLGPEAPIIKGRADDYRAEGYSVFAPGKYGAQAEGSKHWAGMFNERAGNAQPPYAAFHSHRALQNHLDFRVPQSYVIRADGEAGGKGVSLPGSSEEAQDFAHSLMVDGAFGGAGEVTTSVADRYHGPEASAFVVSDGTNYVILPVSQDHKRRNDGDVEGADNPNTGGMGAYAPVPESVMNGDQYEKIDEMADNFMKQMAKEGHPYQGVLYMGVMMAEENNGDPVMIEYNVRFGDPETQVVLPLLERAGIDVYRLLKSAADGELAYTQKDIDNALAKQKMAALTIALTCGDYPASKRKGEWIHGIGYDNEYENVIVHPAAVEFKDGHYQTLGGRVLYVTGLGETVDEAASRAEAAIGENGIHFEGMHYREKIGAQARTR